MEMTIVFGGNKRVNVEFRGFMIQTDQPVAAGGDGLAPTPFNYFLASLGACAGYYVLAFCQSRNISTEGLRLVQRHTVDQQTHKLTDVQIEIQTPPDFPAKYHEALIKAADQCAVKKALFDPPKVTVAVKVIE